MEINTPSRRRHCVLPDRVRHHRDANAGQRAGLPHSSTTVGLPAVLRTAVVGAVLVSVVLSGCGPARTEGVPTPAPTNTRPPNTPTYSPAPPTATHTPVAPTPTDTQTAVPTLTPTPSATATPSVTPTRDPCSGATSTAARRMFTFEELVPCLQDPETVYQFLKVNFSVTGWESGDEVVYHTAQQVYEHGGGFYGPDYAMFAACLLHMNGNSSARVFHIPVVGKWRNVATWEGQGGLYAMDQHGIVGPFDDYEAIVAHFSSGAELEPSWLILIQPCPSTGYSMTEILEPPHEQLR